MCMQFASSNLTASLVVDHPRPHGLDVVLALSSADLPPDVRHVVLRHRDVHRIGGGVEERRVELAPAEVVGLEPRHRLGGDVEARPGVGLRRAVGEYKSSAAICRPIS